MMPPSWYTKQELRTWRREWSWYMANNERSKKTYRAKMAYERSITT